MLAVGMPYDLFWHGDLCALDNYIDMAEIQQAQRLALTNWQCYIQGQYVYTALCCVAPVLNAFASKGTKPRDYPSEPFELKKASDIPTNEMTPELQNERIVLMKYYEMKMLEANERARKIIESEQGGGAHGE